METPEAPARPPEPSETGAGPAPLTWPPPGLERVQRDGWARSEEAELLRLSLDLVLGRSGEETGCSRTFQQLSAELF